MQLEHFFRCPHCNAHISSLLDLSEGSQQYVEDCEVCCRPMRISFGELNGRLLSFSAESDQ